MRTPPVCTACTLDCPDTCSLLVTPGEDKITVRGNPEHPYTHGFVCGKIHAWVRRLSHPQRLRQPLLRRKSGWQPLSWAAALDICAKRLQKSLQTESGCVYIHGEAGRGVLHTAAKRFFQSLGALTPAGSLCDSAGIAACIADFGSLEHNDIRELAASQTIVNWGKDLSRSSVHTAALVRQARRNGAHVISISPGGDGNAPFSDHRLGIRPDGDRFLAAAVLKRLIERKPECGSRLARAHQGAEYGDWLARTSWQSVLALAQCSWQDVDSLAGLYAQGPVASLLGWGMQRYTHGGENVRAIHALAYAAGQIGVPGAGVYFNIGSMRHLALDWLYPHASFARQPFAWNAVGRGLTELAPELVWVAGSNVVNQAPESRQTARALQRAGFTVVVDAFMTDTAQCADLLLPAALMLEQTEIVGSCLHDGVQLARQVVPAAGQSRTDYAIAREISQRLTPSDPLPAEETCLATSIRQSPTLPETAWEDLHEHGFVVAPHPRLAFAGGVTAHPDGRFRCLSGCSAPGSAPQGYPLRLVTTVRRDAIHSQIPPEDQGRPEVRLGPASPAWEQVVPDGQAWLVSPLGALRVRCVVAPDLHPEVVLYRRGDWMACGGGANQLIRAEETDLGQGTAFYEQWVRLEAILGE
ncbi:MAG: molybdopterin-dependent oxidoreductase [Thermodesulfobacteriota bacterium]